jgi:hypothetical protein
MYEEEFKAFMKKEKKNERTINSYVKSVKYYEQYLISYKRGKDLAEANPKDLKNFVAWGTVEGENVYRHLWGIRMYYIFIQCEEMENTNRELMEFVQNETRKLREFPNVDRDSVKKLSSIGISTVNQLLETSRTIEDREELAVKSGSSPEDILKLVKLSDLSRLPGLKKVRGRLFYEAGLDTLPKIAALEPEEIQVILKQYIDQTGFDGSPPTLSEAHVAVVMARFLPEMVEV